MKHYYLLYKPEAEVNYLHLFELMELAEYTPETKAFDTIKYTSVAGLAGKLSFSKSTLDRIIQADSYTPFLSADKANKIIKLENSFTKGCKKPFVCLTDKEVAFLRTHKDNLLCKYLIYMKYNCGRSPEKQDFTAKQFLTACGYSVKSNAQLDNISRYNTLMENAGLVSIVRCRDEAGNKRNIYQYNSLYTYKSKDL